MSEVIVSATVPQPNVREEWETISPILRAHIGDRAFDAWFGDKQAKVEETMDRNRICLSFSTPFIALLVKRDYALKLKALWTEVRGEDVEMIVIARSRSVGAVKDLGINLSKPKPERAKLVDLCSKPIVIDFPPTSDEMETDEVSEAFDLSTVFGDLSQQQCRDIMLEVDHVLHRYAGVMGIGLCVTYVGAGYGIPTSDLTSVITARLPELQEPQMIAISLSRELGRLPLREISRRFRRQERYVINVLEAHEQQRQSDPVFNARMRFHCEYLRGRQQAFRQRQKAFLGR